MSCCNCDCNCNPRDHWELRTDVPQYGTTHLQFEASKFFADAKPNQLISIYVTVSFQGEPPNMHGMGVYKVEGALGFEELIGTMYGVGYNRVFPKELS
jgi:hypothetical protein